MCTVVIRVPEPGEGPIRLLAVRDEAPDVEPIGPPIRVPLGARIEEARIFRIAGDPPPGPYPSFLFFPVSLEFRRAADLKRGDE